MQPIVCRWTMHRINNIPKYVICFLLIILLSCTIQSPASQNKTAAVSQIKNQSTKLKDLPGTDTVVSCTDSDGGDFPNVQGEADLVYSNGQKEAFGDRCLGLNFQLEYLCDGLVPTTINNKCNNSCERGVCS